MTYVWVCMTADPTDVFGSTLTDIDRLAGLVVKTSASREADFSFRIADFSCNTRVVVSWLLNVPATC